MTEKEATKLAKKIKRCLSSIPDDVKVIIGTNEILVLDKDIYNEFEVNPEDAPTLAYEYGGMKNVLGYEEWI
ncbi:hypothetical protein [Paramuribaculum intestinale]|uniref:hypothetical protein n=1 Tax=Paramuribaculum intestinale TaxID=2094151 RepID=UPI0025A96F90|nr:hypothetical protein [Paramuribaculum intestinale]